MSTVQLWRQLRWQILGSHMIVVVAGVTILILASQLVLQQELELLADWRQAAGTIEQEAATLDQLFDETQQRFNQGLFFALFLAALGSIGVGLATSIVLTRSILHSLNEVAYSSRRIAEGRYDERVAVPESTELATLATSFNQMAEALAQIEAQRVRLIGNVSHELRSPLTGIEGYLEGMMDGVFPQNDETFALMYQEVRRLRRLVDDLQELSRVEAGHISLNLTPTTLQPLLQRIINQLQPQTLAQDLHVIFEAPEHPVEAAVDADRTTQIMINLIGNAIRYTPDGGRITVRLSQTEHYIRIEVEDTGLGIPADALPYLFERFYRVDTSRARQSGGSGIGLTISQHLAWAMGGQISVHSDGPGKGSTFTLELPPVPQHTV